MLGWGSPKPGPGLPQYGWVAKDARLPSAFATPSYAAKLQGSGIHPGGARWSTLTDHHGYTTPTLAENHDGGRPPDTPTTAVRSWAVTITGHSADSWTAPMGTALVFVSLTRTSPTTPWQVSGVQVPSAT